MSYGNMQKMLQQAQQMQADMARVQAELVMRPSRERPVVGP